MAKRFKLEIGDIIALPIKDNYQGIGQIVSEYEKLSGGFLLRVYDIKHNEKEEFILESLNKMNVLFQAYTFDAKLYHKDWEVIVNYTDNLKDIKLPYFRLGLRDDNAYIVNHQGKRILPISEKVFDNLNYKTEVGPIRFENALRAYYGYNEWIEENYNIILYSNTLKSIEIAQALGLKPGNLSTLEE